MSECTIHPPENCLHYLSIRLTGDPMGAQCEAVFNGSRCSRIKCFPEARAKAEKAKVKEHLDGKGGGGNTGGRL